MALEGVGNKELHEAIPLQNQCISWFPKLLNSIQGTVYIVVSKALKFNSRDIAIPSVV